MVCIVIFVMVALFRLNDALARQSQEVILAFYFDELEEADPLGSKRGKHKLG